MKKKLFGSFLILLISYAGFSQSENKTAYGHIITSTSVDKIVSKLMKEAGVTGLSLGLVTNNLVGSLKSYGFKNKSTKQPNDTSSNLYAASLSKLVFAFLVMQLVDQGLINLDTPLYRFLPKTLPEYEQYKDLKGDDRWKLITARECLNHTTGFPNWRELNPNGTKKLAIFFTPGTHYAYSGEGLYLLQMVIETVSHQGLEELAKRQIFIPFGMPKTSFVWQTSFDTNYSVGHDKDEDTLPMIKRREANAAGSMETTIGDYTRFISCLMQGKGISSHSRQEMLSPQVNIFSKNQFPSLNSDTTSENREIQLSYGLGCGLFKSIAGWSFFKEGHSEDGWEHYAIGFPGKKLAYVIMTNSLNGESIFKELVEDLSGVTIPWRWEGYTPYRPTVSVAEYILSQYVGIYNGRTKAIISLSKDQLKIEAPAEGLKPTNLYASSENKFFLKTEEASIEFVKQPNRKEIRMLVNDEGEKYELLKAEDKLESSPVDGQLNSEFVLTSNLYSSYIGKYKLAGSTDKTIIIEFKNNHLVANLSGQGSVELIFASDTTFKFKTVIDIKGEFISDSGKVTKLMVDQNGKFEWEKVN